MSQSARTDLLAEMEERFRLAARASRTMVYDLDVRTPRVNAMQGLPYLLGYDPSEAELTLQWWDDRIHTDDVQTWHEAFEKMCRELRDHVLEYRVRHKDGRLLWVEDHATPVCDGEGVIERIVGTVMDITERKKAVEELRESEEFNRSLIENTTAIILRVDPQGHITFANPRALEFFGYSEAELVGKHAVGTIVPERDSSDRDLGEMVKGIAADPDKYHSNTNENMRKNGERVWLEWSNSGIYDSQGHLKEFLSVGIDITARKQAMENEERFATLLRHNPSLLFLKDEAGKYVYLNPAYEKQYALRPDWLGKTDFDFWPKESAELFRRNDAKVLEMGEVCQFLEDSLDLNGNRHCWLCYKFPFTDSQGRHYVGGIGIDSTARVLAEEALHQSEERFRLSMEATTDGLWDWDARTDEVYYSPSYYRILGHEPGDFPGTLKAWKEMIHPDDSERTMQVKMDCVEGRTETFAVEYRMKTHSGEWRWILGRGKCITRDAQGRAIRLIGTHVDITDRKRVEEELAQRTEELQAVLDTTPIAIFMAHDPQCRKISGNLAAQKLVELPQDVNISKSASAEERPTKWQEMRDGVPIQPDDLPLQRAVRGEDIRDYEMDMVFQNGTVKSVIGHATPIRDEKGKLHGGVAVLIDVTAHRAAEEALSRLNAELEQRVAERTAELREKDQLLLVQGRQAAMGEMLGNIAHQWRQPLNNLGLHIQQLPLLYDLGEFNKDALDESVAKSMNLIKHMSKTIDDFRNYFKPDKERVEFSLYTAVENSLSLIADSLKAKHIEVEISTLAEPVIFGYHNEFAQALLNILNNAVDVLTDREIISPKITMVIGVQNRRAVLTVSDNAGGVPEEIIGKIFDPYFTTKTDHKGTGVGLFMSKAIIENSMGGRLTVLNAAKGAEFKIEV